MAVRTSTLAILGCLLGALPPVAAADPAAASDTVRDAWQAGQSRLHELLANTLEFVRRDRPHWFVEQSQDAPDPDAPAGSDAAQLVVQQDRRDGAELLTVRYPIATRGALRTYAGAGLNRAVYFEDGDDGPTMLTRRNRQSSFGAAAEIGTELQMSPRLMLSADLRWADLDGDAVLLRADEGYVGADAFAVGVSVGWRFR
jgi:hypothetical protein